MKDSNIIKEGQEEERKGWDAKEGRKIIKEKQG